MRLLDLCCGAGGWSLGALTAGWSVEGIDLDADAVETYRLNVGPAQQADIREMHRHPGGACRIVIGGVPCQPFSIAGKREGAAREDGTLWLDWLRIACELQADALALENVRGFASWQRATYIHHVIRTIERRGYHVAWQILDAADYGVPQHRDRLFLVGFRSPHARVSFRWPAPSHGPPGHLWLPPYRTVREALGLPADEPRLDRPAPSITKGHDIGRDPARPSRRPIAELRAIVADAGLLDRPSTTICVDPRLATAGHHAHARSGSTVIGPEHLALLQGFPPDFRFAGCKTSQYRQIGNAVCPAVGAAVCGAIRKALEAVGTGCGGQ